MIKNKKISNALFILHTLFFLSGVAALIYQLMWQRLLFGVLGVDLESITIIVSVFMFGLGIGGLCGGYLADRYVSKLPSLYILLELLIAIFGFLSPIVIDCIGSFHYFNTRFFTLFCSFLVFSIPTTLMGATFPVLVTYVNIFVHNIGDAVGGLYFSNTLGAAVGALLSGFILLLFVDLNESVYIAAMINFSITVIAAVYFLSPHKDRIKEKN
ncbi:fused MFS/spermidine synthase [Legionella maceachernii]|uniref:Spermidine synthase n=1 Tax=Legionella maceachernii TaxID=466 RepID=A0A0W0W0N9_9GAMM|nr:fused MFS/spermidine synthase [Legionella maceachernii]KTD25871.1 spermidine synthase [Legionella maceachernii]SJZ47421.1 Major Facilitator Superfamily protein [Legionella maceachernii]SUP03917.1 spermidine synthase [Legionella maceachernii]